MGHVVIAPAISIHALREEGDPASCLTLSCSVISIHALREEGDSGLRAKPAGRNDFYPRPPRGGRRQQAGEGYER